MSDCSRNKGAIENHVFLGLASNLLGCQWTGAIDVPLIKDLLLDGRISSQEVVKGLNMWLCTVCREGQVVICDAPG